MLNTLIRKIRRLAGRALIRRVRYANKVRYFQIQQEDGMPLDNVEHFEPFGFTSHPLPNAETVVLAFNGNGSHSIAIMAGDQQYRLEIEEGEAAIYNHLGDKVHIKKDSTISVEAATKVELVTPHTHITGKLTVAETIDATGQITSADNITAVGIVQGASLVNAAGSASMGEGGTMQVTDVVAGGISLTGHTHSNGNNGGNTGGPQ
ncbi:phage baseplate assembly protein V [Marinomonas transparens]|uniref:Phage baseplate assembly protein V n=1 Tax=Marinomonas transparens TaxID=2795388 RepID=A0A934MVL3_9GAMM|nr:phage baseplate assembly protein V [Marinomonas transparens]MBJ7537159.1 phage baseplate assembly protein V [Marinomonas transparens]